MKKLLLVMLFGIGLMGCNPQPASEGSHMEEGQNWKNVAYAATSDAGLLSAISKELALGGIESYGIQGRVAALRVRTRDRRRARVLVIELLKLPKFNGKVRLSED
ncbi:MAG TPA: hypothetical protein PLO61_09860 [Fimbriimonadaceae bacterium]|nr:hypothetical protein [Fimbriimonadaceae bacterium]HRJ33906.1 hypothetical protein [Fimbriimonadaceae bacterium]